MIIWTDLVTAGLRDGPVMGALRRTICKMMWIFGFVPGEVGSSR